VCCSLLCHKGFSPAGSFISLSRKIINTMSGKCVVSMDKGE